MSKTPRTERILRNRQGRTRTPLTVLGYVAPKSGKSGPFNKAREMARRVKQKEQQQ